MNVAGAVFKTVRGGQNKEKITLIVNNLMIVEFLQKLNVLVVL